MTLLSRETAPYGVKILSLQLNSDRRGTHTEIFRASWDAGVNLIQWNAVRNEANVLRGLHIHVWHDDYLIMVAGSMLLGLKDVRPESPTHGCGGWMELDADNPCAVIIPTGVAHSFYFPRPAINVYGVTHYWNAADELGCRWDDPEIGVAWPYHDPILSERDAKAGSYKKMVEAYLNSRAKPYPAAAAA